MAQLQGNNSTDGGRLDGSIGTAIAASDIALGVGWGSTGAVAVSAGSNDQRGEFTITAGGTGLAQATATVALTFADGAYASTPFAICQLAESSNAVTEAQPTVVAATTTALSFTHSVLPVTAKTYRYIYHVVA
jgi:hypothetical protein